MEAPNNLSFVLNLFGPFELWLSGEPVRRRPARKGQWLLALLALHHPAPVERRWLAGMLWPESLEEQGRAYLRDSLSDLRQLLGVEAWRLGPHYTSTLWLDLRDAWVDVVAFDVQIIDASPESVKEALDIFNRRGRLLDGCPEEWVLQERQKREEAYLTALERLAKLAQDQGDLASAAIYLRRAVDTNPLRGSNQRALLQALADRGEYAAASMTYRTLRTRLDREFNIGIDPATTALFRQIRAEGQRAVRDDDKRSAPPPASATSPAPPVLGDTLTFLSTDIEGSTPLVQEYGEAMHVAMATHHDHVRQAVEAHSGSVFKAMGDGSYAVFANAAAAVSAALAAQEEIQQEVWDRIGSLQVRIVVHTGTATWLDGEYYGLDLHRINRLVKACHGGQILLSHATREAVGDGLPEAAHLRDLGSHPIEGWNQPVQIFQLMHPALPGAFPPPRIARSSERSASVQETPPHSRRERPRVVLLYKRHTQPDEELLKLLEARLIEEGFQVFSDRHLSIGVEWARAVEQEIREADAVIPLLSGEAVHSEMLSYELRAAQEAGHKRQGKPRLLPVRVNYTGVFPYPLAPILEPLHDALWESPQDDGRLIGELLRALRAPDAPCEPVAPRKPVSLGGAVDLGSEFYVERSTDPAFQAAIHRHDGIIRIKGPRQMGKTSLLGRGGQQARATGAQWLWTDLAPLDPTAFESADAFFRQLAELIAAQLNLDVLPDEVWRPYAGAGANFDRYVRREVWGKLEGQLIWGIDTVDRLLGLPFCSQVFALFRSWFEEGRVAPNSPWPRLTLVIAHATEPHLFITDINQSPFNVGTRLVLEDFTREQVEELNRRHGSPLRDAEEVTRLYQLVGGQPYLVRQALSAMVTQDMEITTLETQADRDAGIFVDHLPQMLALLAKNDNLCAAVRGVLQGHACPTADSFYRLRSAGVIVGESPADVHLRCQLYHSYLSRHLL
jgi:class 3 adenylate cyclase